LKPLFLPNKKNNIRRLSTLVALIVLSSSYNQIILSPNSENSQFYNANQEFVLRQNTCPVKQDVPPTGTLNSSEFNITCSEGYYEGYNLFVLDKMNTVTHFQEIHLAVIDMEGNIISSRYLGTSPALVYSVAKFINSTTVLLGGINLPFLWNFFENTTENLVFSEHHDIEYISESNTYLTLQREEVVIEDNVYSFDRIVEYTPTGELVWSISTQSFVSYTDWCPFQDMYGNTRSITHSNSLFYNPNDDSILLGCRNMNTIYKINHTSSELIWSLGEHGEFDLYDQYGNLKDSLWYHAHAFEFFDDNKIICFDNDYHNQTNPLNQQSRIVEIEIDENNKTAREIWTYEAPKEYFSSIWGDSDKLPNGNRLATFGSIYETIITRDAKVLEVNEEKEIVWQLEFYPNSLYSYGLYRWERFTPKPGMEQVEHIYSNSIDNTTIQLDTWSGYRTRSYLTGYYSVYLNDSLIEEGIHTFEPYWKISSLNLNLGRLAKGVYNLTIVLEDDVSHQVSQTIIVEVKSFYVERTGPTEIELGQVNSIINWEGKAETPLQTNLSVDESLLNSTTWFSSNVSLDLNDLSIGEHKIEFLLYNSTELVYNETFSVYVYLAEAPQVFPVSDSKSVYWGQDGYIYWNLFDNTPKKWEIWINNSLTKMESWSEKSYELVWKIPLLDEGEYNITLILSDWAGFQSSSIVYLTVEPPLIPIVSYLYGELEYQYGTGNISLAWSVHGGTTWYIWVDDVVYTQGTLTETIIILQTNDWDSGVWKLGRHNVTLEIYDKRDIGITSSVDVFIWLNMADPYADEIVPSLSDVYYNGENALGEPDNETCQLVETYTHGYITVDMGEFEEILNQNGDDFYVYASGDEYQVWVGNDIESQFEYLGSATGNEGFNLGLISFDSARFVRIQFTSGVFVNVDAIEALYYNVPVWDIYPPFIHHKPNIEVLRSQRNVELKWVVWDSNPLNYSIYVDDGIFQQGDWSGNPISCNIPLIRIGEIDVRMILFDTFGNYAETQLTITVLNDDSLSKILTITLYSVLAISYVSIKASKTLKMRRKARQNK